MVEPIAAAVFNKLLPGGTAFKRSSSVHSLARAVSSSRRKALTPGFFTPEPRRTSAKGKEREVDASNCQIWECQEWLNCAEHHAVWCPHHYRSMMLQELNQDNHTPYRHRRSRPVGNPHTRRKPFSITSRAFGHQRRHASSSPKLIRTPTLPEALLDPRQLSQAQISEELSRLVRRRPHDFDRELAWDLYTSLQAPPSRLVTLSLADQLLHTVERLYETKGVYEETNFWAERALQVLEGVDSESIQWQDWVNKLYARANAALGHIEQAVTYASRSQATTESASTKSNIRLVWEPILLSISYHKDPTAVLDFITSHWGLLNSHISERGSSLQRTVFHLLARIEDPSQVISHKRDHLTPEQRQNAGRLLIDVFGFFGHSRDALAVLDELKKQQLTVPTESKLFIVRRLADDGAFGHAEALFSSIVDHEHRKVILSTGLYLHSRQGHREAAARRFRQLEAEELAEPHDTVNYLFAYAKAGDVDGVQERFNECFPRGPDNKRLSSPSAAHYSPVILALSKRGLSDEIAVWLEDLSSAGLKPDVHTYTLVLQALACGNDLRGALSVLKTMQTEGLQPNAVAYTIVITLLATRGDAAGAEAVFKRALQDGVIPDTKMLTTLMNAHVEAGSWKGVIRVYDFINSSRIRSRIRMSIDVYNTLLKAYVMSGAPFSIVAKVFQVLEDSKVKPDDHTFCLLIQSACDSDKMDLASEMFWRMEELASHRKERDLTVNVYVLTILMSGYLRVGNKVKAKAVYDEMIERGIDPSAVTFSTILRAYGNEGTEESMKIAEEFIQNLLKAPAEEQTWNRPLPGRKTAIQAIYSPVIHAYSRQEKLEDVQRLFEEMLSHGAPPSLGTLTMVLDACRRTFNIEGVFEVWPQILQLGLQYLNALPDDIKGDHSGFPIGSNILCVPLSIYIDALSAAGRHADIAETWHEMKALGFSYDSHNYNHLVVALIRAGQVERAFEVIDRVLLPNHLRARRFVPTRNTSPISPLIFQSIAEANAELGEAAEVTAAEQPHDVPNDRPRHHSPRRAAKVKKSTRNLLYEDVWNEDNIGQHDLARPLHIMHQLSPSWGMWRPHAAVLTVLLQAHAKLERGELIYPVPELGTDPMPPIENEAQHAKTVLQNIYKTYPVAVQVVLKHENYEKRRLGLDYDRVYNW